MTLRVAVVGGGPAGASAAEVLAKAGIETYLIERKLDNVKPCGGKIIRVEAHPIPEHPRPRRVVGRVALVGDAAGTVTKSSGEGIYFAAKSARMCAETIVECSENGQWPNFSCPLACIFGSGS